MKKRIIGTILTVAVLLAFGICALGSGDDTKTDQGTDKATAENVDENNLGDYSIEIKSCRLAKDIEEKDVVIITYGYTNNSDDATSFDIAFKDSAYQNDIGLNKAYFLADDADYNSDNQQKEIKKGATLDVEVAYELNDTTSDVVVEVSELISFNDSVVKKTFEIA